MKTTFKYDHYYLYEEVKSNLETLAKAHSDIMSIESIAKSQKGRDVFAVTLSNGDPTKKPAYYVDGNTHAGEVTGSMAAMHTIDYLVTNYGKVESVTKLLTDNTVYVIPRISPDGAEAYLTSWHKLRSVDHPYFATLDVEDGKLYDEDIDNDGVLRTMRIKSPVGVWKKHPENPNLVVKRKPNEKDGEFYNIYSEGMIKNFDGCTINASKPVWGNDFNRNYPFGWFSEVRQPGAGPYPLSNTETKAVVDFVLAHKNIGGVCTHHTHSGIILCPPGTRPEKTMSPLDKKIIREIAETGSKECDYPVVQIFDAFMTDQENYSSGAFDDWCYQQNGIPAYTIELWNMEKLAGCETPWPPKPKTPEEEAEDYAKVIAWCEKNAPEAFLPWTKFNHPQLGEIEIGGLDHKFTTQNPPCSMLLAEVEKVTKMTLEMAKSLPEVVVDHVDTTKVGDNTYKVEAYILNKGYLPTYLTTQAKTMAVDEPVKVAIHSTGSVASDTNIVLGDLEGWSGINSYESFYGISTGNHLPCMKKVTAYVSGDEGTTVTFTITGNKIGTVEHTVTL